MEEDKKTETNKYSIIDSIVRGWMLSLLGCGIIVIYLLLLLRSEKLGVDKASLPPFLFEPLTAGIVLVVSIWLIVTKPSSIEKETNTVIEKITDKFFKSNTPPSS